MCGCVVDMFYVKLLKMPNYIPIFSGSFPYYGSNNLIFSPGWI